MNSLDRVSLEDTLKLVQLVRETALAKGRDMQAKQLGPVLDEMQGIVAASRKNAPTAPQPKGDMAQEDFQTLLKLSQAKTGAEQPAGAGVNSAMERNRLMQAMAAGNMSDIEIARQFGVTREEVRLVLSVQKNGLTAGKGNV